MEALHDFNTSYGMIISCLVLVIYCFVQSRTIIHLKKSLETVRDELNSYKSKFGVFEVKNND